MDTVPKPPIKSARARRVAAASPASAVSPPPKIKPTGVKPAVPTGNTAAPSAGLTPAPAATPAPVTAPVVTAPAPAAPAPVPAIVAETIPEPVVEAPVAPTPPIAAKDITMETIENVTAKAQTAFNQATEHTKGAVEKGQKLFDDASEFGKGNIEAMVESSKIAARGFETLGQEAAAFAKKSFEEATAVAKTLASVKSPTELMKLQSDYVRSAFEAMVQQTSHNTEALLKLAGEVAQPLSNRAALAAEKMKVAA